MRPAARSSSGPERRETPVSEAIEVLRRRLTVDGPQGVRLGEPQVAGSLAVLPIYHEGSGVEYLLHAEAQAQGLVSVTEVSAEGAVPALLVRNKADSPVLFVEGEVLVGLKQNRVINVSVLVPARAKTTIPVACVEAGRWHRASSVAGRDDFHLSPAVRRVKNQSVARAARGGASYLADQTAVWNGVAERLAAHNVDSQSAAYSDVGNRKRKEIADSLVALKAAPGQCGVLAIVESEPICLDLFDRPETVTAVWHGLIGSYIADSLLAWIENLAGGCATEHAGVGLGITVALTSSDTTATGLVADGVLVHLAAFRGHGARAETRFAPPSAHR
jgi:ARG/rhodanese/phosphatase superfamily protein